MIKKVCIYFLHGKKVKQNNGNGTYGIHTRKLHIQDIHPPSLCFSSKIKVLENLN